MIVETINYLLSNNLDERYHQHQRKTPMRERDRKASRLHPVTYVHGDRGTQPCILK